MSETPHDVSPDITERAFETFSKSDVLLRVPMGLASPLWGFFAGAAMSGSAWWWMTRFARIENLEAMFGAAEVQAVKAATLPLPAVEAVVSAAIETLDAVEGAVEGAVATVVEPAAEAAVAAQVEATAEVLDERPAEPPPILETLATAPEIATPVGGESAPISPVVAAAAPEPQAAIRPKKKTPPTQAD
ncbi:hypothetical protein [Phenylobacterium sp.]|jgi:hypothetical protein|uniref:hypothetical protein n=1 Tax=Phenylobacterium sp. TaxID=1871053 RepID=UPI002F3EDC28